jgi:hypothetical protein
MITPFAATTKLRFSGNDSVFLGTVNQISVSVAYNRATGVRFGRLCCGETSLAG